MNETRTEGSCTTPFFSAVYWLGLYLLLVLAPLFVLLIGPVPPGSGFWWDLSMALGFSGMAIMGVLFFLTARFRRATAPFGIDIIYYFHRYLALMAFGLIFLHFLIIRIDNVEALGAINPLQASWYMTSGRVALLLFALIIITSLWRKPLRIHYDQWRMLHIGLAVTTFLLALGHIEGVGYYIEAPAKRWLWTGYTLFWLLLIAYVRLIKPWQMSNRPYRVAELRQEHGNSWTLALEPDGHQGMRFKPGQFAWLTLRASPWHIKEHPFSLSSSADRHDRLEFTIKELGDFTRTIKQSQVGEIAYLDGPYGVFSVDRYPDAPGFVFIAGGVGAAPIVSMLRTLADRHEQRPMWLIYGNNRWQDVIFREELEALKQRLDLRLLHVLKEPPSDWKGESGLITPELLQKVLPGDAQKLEYFLCGPRPMSDASQQGLHALKVPLCQIHFELFDMV
ncbi:MAG: ferric reductase-like transmembrane domain-containing protein [Proteobacteria bacterium]|nr:ferric reductase-like transmembrane domain-containing protein [Pseudomonadota bacterium]